MSSIRLVTGNSGKAGEVKAALKGVKIEVVNPGYPEIQADTLEEVVEFGIEWLKNKIETPFILDDSGLFIHALCGFPGVYSSYVFRTIGNSGVLKLLENREREATFATVLGYYDGEAHIIRGECNGSIAMEERGSNGFGFDPIFIPKGSEKTFAEMDVDEKNRISHRGRALSKLADMLGVK